MRLLAGRADEGVGKEISDELSFHIERRTEDNIEAGMSPADAQRDALERFGDVEDITLSGKAIRSEHSIRSIGFDLRQAVRGIRRNPGFAAVTIVTLGLGIGATTAIFSLVNGVVLNPLPHPDPDRILYLEHAVAGIEFEGELGIAPGLYQIYSERSETLEQLGSFDAAELTLTGEGDPERLAGATVSASFFQILGARPEHGRLLTEEDDEVGSDRVVLLSHRLWQRRYSSDPNVVGTTIQVNGVSRQVVGVLPADFRFDLIPDADLWLDSERRPSLFGGFGDLSGIARMKSPMTLADVRRDLDARIAELLDLFDDPRLRQVLADAQISARPLMLKQKVVGDIERTLWVLLGTVWFVLLIACANVANLFLVRAEARQRETAVRMALGAGRGQLARYFLAESTLLALLGGVAGVAIASAALRFLVRNAPVTIPRLEEVGIDAAVLAFALVITLVTGLLFGSVPVFRSGSRFSGQLQDSGRGSTAGRSRIRARQVLVVGQVALALVLLVGSGLMARSFWHLKSIDPGFDPNSVLRFRLSLPPSLYEAEDAAAFHHELLDKLAALPGVTSVGAARELPMERIIAGNLMYVEGEPIEEGILPPLSHRTRVTEGYFETIGLPLVAGRTLRRSDSEQRTNAVVINTEAADLYFRGQDPVGKRVHSENSFLEDEIVWWTIVGVVGSHRQENLIRDPPPMFYISMLGGDFDNAQLMGHVVRTAVPPQTLADAVRRTVWDLDPALPIVGLRTMEEAVDDAGAPMGFVMVLLGIAASVALLLGTVGVYGVLAYVVRQRTGEIGVRMALGAQAGDVRRMLLSQGALIGAVGLGIGLAGSFALVCFMEALLFGVDPLDPATHVAVGLLIFGVVLLATWLPARRASRIDPIVALRSE